METKKREIVIEEAYFAPRWEPYYHVYSICADGKRTLLATMPCKKRAQEYKSGMRNMLVPKKKEI